MPIVVNNLIRTLRGALPVSVVATVLAAGIPQLVDAAPAQGRPNHSLIIFAPDSESEAFIKQKKVVAAETDELQKRNVSVIYVVGRKVSSALGRDLRAIPATLRLRFRVGKDDFRAILVDKDGETQMLSDAPVSADQIYQTMDATPVSEDQ
jgi:hypothetical protein